MVSDTQKTERQRRRKLAKSGKDRKRRLAVQGSTPSFPVHPPVEGEPKTPAKA